MKTNETLTLVNHSSILIEDHKNNFSLLTGQFIRPPILFFLIKLSPILKVENIYLFDLLDSFSKGFF